MGKNRRSGGSGGNNGNENDLSSEIPRNVEEYSSTLFKYDTSTEGDTNIMMDDNVAGKRSTKDIEDLTQEDIDEIKQYMDLMQQYNPWGMVTAPYTKEGLNNTQESIRRTINNYFHGNGRSEGTSLAEQVERDLKEAQKTKQFVKEKGSRKVSHGIPNPDNVGLKGSKTGDYYPWM